MPFETGTATNHVDLFDRLVTFLSEKQETNQNWEILRYTGVAEVDASSRLVEWEPWRVFKGPYHNHENGWSTAEGEHGNSWLRWKMVRPFDVQRLQIKGSADASQSPRDFTLQYSDDGEIWSDRQAFTEVSWSASETKTFTIDGASPGPKPWWRLFIASNNGHASRTQIQQILLPQWEVFHEFNQARRPAVWFRAPGMTGLDSCYINLQLYDRPTSDYYNIAVTGCTGFTGSSDFDNQPGALKAMALPLWNQPIPYWFSGNGQRVIISVRVDTVYLGCYLGKMLPFGTPGQFPYPLVIGAPLPTASGNRYSDGAVNLPYKGNRSTFKLRGVDGVWVQPSVWPFSAKLPWHPYTEITFRDTGGAYPLLPLTLYDNANTYGTLDGIHFITGFGNAVENTVILGDETHLVLQDGARNGLKDFFTMRIS